MTIERDRPSFSGGSALGSSTRVVELTTSSAELPAWTLTPAQRDDVDLLQMGGYAPLDGFLTRRESSAVVRSGRLPDGTAWPAPLTLQVTEPTASEARSRGRLALRDDDGTLLAVLTVTDTWQTSGGWSMGGTLEGVRTSVRWDFADLHATVPEIRATLALHGGPILAAQPPGAVDRRTALRWMRASEDLDAQLLVLPAVGSDPDRHLLARVRGYRALLSHLPATTRLWLVPSGRPPADPQSAALHAVVARNVGATYLLTDDGAVAAVASSLGLDPAAPARYADPTDPPPGLLHEEVSAALRSAHQSPSHRGFVVFLTGLSGAGKSTIAKGLRARLAEAGDRQVTLLDGDLVRQHLSSELGFSREHRDLNVRRIGFVASEIAKHGGVAICAPIAPYDRARREVREMVRAAGGGFLLVHVATSLTVCEERDVKGLYARVRLGQLPGFTGIDDPYEEPADAEIVLDTASQTPSVAVDAILTWLGAEGWHGNV